MLFRIINKSLRHAPANLVRRFSHDACGSLGRVNSGHHERGVGACFRWNSKGGSIKQFERVSNSILAQSAGDFGRKYSSIALKSGTIGFSHKGNVSLWQQPGRQYSSNADLPPHQEIGMPSLSPTMTEGNIARWIKKEGDKISPGEVLCEVETDKATVEMECMEDGYLAKIIRGDGSQGIKVGEVIAVTVEEEEFLPSLKDYTPSGTADSETKQSSESPAPKKQSAEPIKQSPEPTKQASSADLPPHQEIGMPSLSPTMTEGNIARWIKKEGDKVSPGEVLCEVETDKATVEMECMEDGYLAKIIQGDGAQGIKVGELIAITVEEEEHLQKFKDYTPKLETAAPETKKPSEPAAPKKQSHEPLNQTEPDMLKSSEKSPGDHISASPPANKKAQDHNAAKGVGLNYSDIPHSQIRKVTASRLLTSKQTIPHYYLTVDTCVDNLMELRSQLNLSLEASGGKRISVNDLVIKAAALALKKVPECNSSWTEDSIRQYHNVNINVAVQTENGLYVPVIRDADKKGLTEIAEEVKLLAQRARENSLKPEDYEGGTFTVSNLGGPFGIKQFCAIVNPPQAAILAIGTAEKRVAPGTGNNLLKVASFMPVSLSCDHRVIDGAIGAEWLKAFKGFIENPKSMLL